MIILRDKDGNHPRVIMSDPKIFRLMVAPERPVLWTWQRLIDKTAPTWERTQHTKSAQS